MRPFNNPLQGKLTDRSLARFEDVDHHGSRWQAQPVPLVKPIPKLFLRLALSVRSSVPSDPSVHPLTWPYAEAALLSTDFVVHRPERQGAEPGENRLRVWLDLP